MITLITGAPGTGKTAWLINEILELRKIEPNKLLFIHGIRNLRGIAHETIFCKSQLCDICRGQEIPENAKYVEYYPDWKVSDSLIIVDEVQRIWRPRSGGSQPSEAVSGLETHRHYGLDFWLISQGPHLFDNFIRLLVGRHVHLVSRWSGRTQYEFPECKQDVSSRSDAVVRPYKLPLHVYKHYDSAEVHTKQDKRKPLSFYATIVAVLLSSIMIIFVGSRINKKFNPEIVTKQVTGGGDSSAPPVAVPLPTVSSVNLPDFEPVLINKPETAPAYVDLLKVTAIPILVGCVSTKVSCKCYTPQGSPYPTSELFCREQIKGNYFNPYRVNRSKSDFFQDKSNPENKSSKSITTADNSNPITVPQLNDSN